MDASMQEQSERPVPDACENTSTVVRGDATRPLLPAESAAGMGTAMGLNSGSSRAVS